MESNLHHGQIKSNLEKLTVLLNLYEYWHQTHHWHCGVQLKTLALLSKFMFHSFKITNQFRVFLSFYWIFFSMRSFHRKSHCHLLLETPCSLFHFCDKISEIIRHKIFGDFYIFRCDSVSRLWMWMADKISCYVMSCLSNSPSSSFSNLI